MASRLKARRKKQEEEKSLNDLDMILAKTALMASSDQESVVSSGSLDSDEDRDWVRGLAQRATEPNIKERVKKGTFVFVKPAFKTGRHFYVNEELERIKTDTVQRHIKGQLKGKQYKVTGTITFDKHGEPEGFTVEDVLLPSGPDAPAPNPPAAQPVADAGKAQEQALAHSIASKAAESAPVLEEATAAVKAAIGDQAMATPAAAATTATAAPVPAASAATEAVPEPAAPAASDAAPVAQPAAVQAPAPAADGQNLPSGLEPPSAPPEAPKAADPPKLQDKKQSPDQADPRQDEDRDKQRRPDRREDGERRHRRGDERRSGRDRNSDDRQEEGRRRRPDDRAADRDRHSRRRGEGEGRDRREGRNADRRDDRHRRDRYREERKDEDAAAPEPTRPAPRPPAPPSEASQGSSNRSNPPQRKRYNAREQEQEQKPDQDDGFAIDLTDSGGEQETDKVFTGTRTLPTDPRERMRTRKLKEWSSSSEDEATVTARRTARAAERAAEKAQAETATTSTGQLLTPYEDSDSDRDAPLGKAARAQAEAMLGTTTGARKFARGSDDDDDF